MKIALSFVFAILCTPGQAAFAQGLLNSHESITIQAPADKVWDAVRDFDGLANWHPMFSSGVIKSGRNNEPGAVRTMTVKDGPSFDEELLTFDEAGRKFTYRLIDPVPLPVSAYTGAFQVVAVKRGTAAILWSSTYRNNSGGKMKDEEVIRFINGAFRAGLENLKTRFEAN